VQLADYWRAAFIGPVAGSRQMPIKGIDRAAAKCCAIPSLATMFSINLQTVHSSSAVPTPTRQHSRGAPSDA